MYNNPYDTIKLEPKWKKIIGILLIILGIIGFVSMDYINYIFNNEMIMIISSIISIIIAGIGLVLFSNYNWAEKNYKYSKKNISKTVTYGKDLKNSTPSNNLQKLNETLILLEETYSNAVNDLNNGVSREELTMLYKNNKIDSETYYTMLNAISQLEIIIIECPKRIEQIKNDINNLK